MLQRVNQTLWEQSYRRVALELSEPASVIRLSHLRDNCHERDWIAEASRLVGPLGTDFDHVIFVLASTPAECHFDTLYADHGGAFARIDRRALVDEATAVNVFLVAFGHMFGLEGSGTLSCITEKRRSRHLSETELGSEGGALYSTECGSACSAQGAMLPPSESCWGSVHGHPYDALSIVRRRSTYFSAFQRFHAGWLDARNVRQIARRNATYRLDVLGKARNTGILALRVPLPKPYRIHRTAHNFFHVTHIYFEVVQADRVPADFWRAACLAKSMDLPTTGVAIHLTDDFDEPAPAYLIPRVLCQVGDVFSDPANGILVTLKRLSDNRATLQVCEIK